MSGKRPTHSILAVEKNGDRSYYTPIGAAWAHEDGDGLTLKFKFWPTVGQTF